MGPSASMTRKPERERHTLHDGRGPGEGDLARLDEPVGTNCAASIADDHEHEHRLDEGADPPAVTSPTSIDTACSKVSARKNTHARHTTWNVTNHRTTGVHGSVRPARPRRRRGPTRRSITSAAPWMAPHTTKVQAAPCHRPPITMVRNRLRSVRRSPPGVPAQRDVEVVAQPRDSVMCQRRQNALDRGGRVGRVEVLGEAEPEQQRAADGDVGVAAEVRVDLDGVARRSPNRISRFVCASGFANTGSTIADATKLEMTTFLNRPAKISRSASAASSRRGSGHLVELRQQLARPHDRPGDEVREERQVDREVEERRRLGVPSVRVDDVAEGLEGEEGDPDREDHLHQRRVHVETEPAQPVGHRRDEEPVVLEVGEDAEVRHHRAGQQQAGVAARLGRAVDRHRGELVDDRRRGEQQDEARVPPAVEDVAGRQDEQPPGQRSRSEQPAHDEGQTEEDRELEGGEQQARRSSRGVPAALLMPTWTR